MTWILVNGGQTGVDRGALHGARAVGMSIEGDLPADWAAEDGPLPEELRTGLNAMSRGTYAQRTRSNVLRSDVVLLVVPNVLRPCLTPGTELTARLALEFQRPVLATEGRDPGFVRKWLQQALALRRGVRGSAQDSRVMVAGPRASKWSEGEFFASQLVCELFANVARAAVARQLELPL